MENILLQSALKYAKRGWHVFPTREKDSKPFINDKGKEIIIPMKAPYVKSGFKSCTTDESTIKEWWKKYPEAGIGISCGHSGIVVVDIDIRDGKKGFDSFASLDQHLLCRTCHITL